VEAFFSKMSPKIVQSRVKPLTFLRSEKTKNQVRRQFSIYRKKTDGAMNRSSIHSHALKELINLAWCALRQEHSDSCNIDDESYHFFHTLPKPLPSKRYSRVDAVVQPESLKTTGDEQTVSITSGKKEDSSQIQELIQKTEDQSMDSIPDVSEQGSMQSHRRLEKLLPRPFSTTPPDIAATRKSIQSASTASNLSAVPLYQDPPAKPGSKRWAVFTFIPPSDPPSAKEKFITSVVQAIDERLPVAIAQYSCYDPSFSLHLPVVVDDCEVVIFFVDSHLKTALTTLLESVQTFTATSQSPESPFTILGTVHGRPIRALMLHTSTHEDGAIKGALWKSLKALATLTPPQ
jgi:hypothetical protein